MALSLCGCGVEAPGETTPSMESSEAALMCQVFQGCPDRSSVTCMSESTACLPGTDSGGRVEYDGVRTYCFPACACESPPRVPVLGLGLGLGCDDAYRQHSTMR